MKSFLCFMAALAAACSFAPARAEDPAETPPELKVLAKMVGTWDEAVSNKPTEWLPTAEKSTSVTKKQWALGGKFLRMEGAWNPAKIEFISLLTHDAATGEYRTWYFDSTGGFPPVDLRGAWDEKKQTITWKATDAAGNKTAGTTKIVDENRHEWTMVITNPEGKVVLDMQAINTRRKE